MQVRARDWAGKRAAHACTLLPGGAAGGQHGAVKDSVCHAHRAAHPASAHAVHVPYAAVQLTRQHGLSPPPLPAQTDSIVPSQRKYTDIRTTARLLWAEGGVRRFYKGFAPCLIRAAPANGVMLLTVDKVRHRQRSAMSDGLGCLDCMCHAVPSFPECASHECLPHYARRSHSYSTVCEVCSADWCARHCRSGARCCGAPSASRALRPLAISTADAGRLADWPRHSYDNTFCHVS
jgi:hypothetical protein